MGVNIKVVQTDFIRSDGFEWEYREYDPNSDDDWIGKRPKGIQAAMSWVKTKDNLPSSWSRKRFENLLKILRQHPDWYIST